LSRVNTKRRAHKRDLSLGDCGTPPDLLTLDLLARWGAYISCKVRTRAYYFDRGLAKGNVLTWDSRVFERLPSGLYQLNRYRFIERIYPVVRMKSALSEHFDILETSLREKGIVILFVCRKR
jgi:hypothetical protein